MVLLIDLLRTKGWRGCPWMSQEVFRSESRRVLPHLHDAKVIEATNVCEYLFAGTPQEHWDYQRDFPCVAPPFETFWIEMARPSRIVSEEHGTILPEQSYPIRWGFLFEAIDAGHVKAKIESSPPSAIRDARLAWIAARNYRWSMLATGFMEFAGEPQPVGCTVEWKFFLDEDGAIIEEPVFGTARDDTLPPDVYPVEWIEELMSSTCGMMYPALLTLTFMHCKNVERIDNEGGASRQERRAWVRRFKEPLSRFTTLRIDPARTVVDRELSKGTPIGRALSIARGHFKTYTQEKPLLGRHVGRFWWPMHLRGSRAHGEVTHAYRVVAPSNPAHDVPR